MSDECYYKTLGIDFGPVSLHVIRELIHQKVLGPGDQFRTGSGKWRDVAEIISPVVTSPPSGQIQESTPWIYLARTGVVGPLTTGLLLEAVQSGCVQPKTMIRLVQSPEWIAAEQIEGLVFPQSISPDVPAPTSPPASRVSTTQTALNAEMRHLFAECVSRQRASQPVHPAHTSQSIDEGISSRVGGTIASTASEVLSGFLLVMEWLVALPIYLMRSRVAWGLAGLLIVIFSVPRISALLTTQEQVYSTLLGTYQELAELRSNQADANAWDEFQNKASRELAHLVPQLEKNAVINDKTSMSLLWLARDYLPAALQNPQALTPEAESKVEQHFAIVREELQRPVQSYVDWDPWTKLIVGLDVLGVLAAVIYFARKR